jgi:hypothetical protein
MATITFDTLKFVEKLEKARMSRDQASAIAEAQKDAFSEAMDSQIATKSDLLEMENRLIKWGLGLTLGHLVRSLLLLHWLRCYNPKWQSMGRVENRLAPALPHETVNALFSIRPLSEPCIWGKTGASLSLLHL